MKTSHLSCIALVVTLMVATTSLADTYVVAQAGENHTFDYDTEGGGFDISVGGAGYYNWSYSLTAYARVYVRGTGSPSGCSAYADASAEVTSPNGNDDAYAQASVSGSFTEDTDSDPASDSGYHYVSAGVVLSFDDESYAEGTTSGAPGIQAYGKATTTTSGSVW